MGPGLCNQFSGLIQEFGPQKPLSIFFWFTKKMLKIKISKMDAVDFKDLD